MYFISNTNACERQDSELFFCLLCCSHSKQVNIVIYIIRSIVIILYQRSNTDIFVFRSIGVNLYRCSNDLRSFYDFTISEIPGATPDGIVEISLLIFINEIEWEKLTELFCKQYFIWMDKKWASIFKSVFRSVPERWHFVPI